MKYACPSPAIVSDQLALMTSEENCPCVNVSDRPGLSAANLLACSAVG
jgi:hypothetical protein